MPDNTLHPSKFALEHLSFEEFPQLQEKQFFRIRDDLNDEFPNFLTLFAQHSKNLLATIHESLANNNQEQVKISLHSFKGMCGTMGATRLFQLCKQAENTEQLTTQQQLISYIEMELLELDAVIKQVLDGL